MKLKICTECNEPKPIWKSVGKTDKYCKQCWFSLEPPKKISPVSKKKKEEMSEYSKLRTAFLVIHPFCEAKLQGCTSSATDVHHLYSGRDREKYYLTISTWKAICRNCHNIVHNVLSSEEAVSLGLKKVD